MEYNNSMILKALNFAEKAHLGQTYTNPGDYFEAHIRKVWYNVLIHGGTVLEQVVAILHDVMEDTPISESQIADDFGAEVAHHVYLLSRNPSENYFDYIRGLKDDPVCKKVKIEDLDCNYKASIISGNESLSNRHARAILILMGYS